jgi:hypothetical protein
MGQLLAFPSKETSMKFNMSQKIRNFDGTTVPVEAPRKKGGVEDMTIGRAAIDVLLAFNPHLPRHQEMTGEEKAWRYSTAIKIRDYESAVEMSLEDAARLKKLVGEMGSPQMVGNFEEFFSAIEQSKKRGKNNA